jgi:hypothetical protein
MIAARATRWFTPMYNPLDRNDGHRNSYEGQNEEEEEVHGRVYGLVLLV